ncbi:MAG: hypothetical protein IJK46_05950 [Prevotella sp.]|nr:hypothetical protein [Prevotella sp.]
MRYPDLPRYWTSYARSLELDSHDDINTLGHPARRAYYMGLDETDKELRQQQLDLMRAGSPTAIADCQQRIERVLNEIAV